jgi:hypothetical protein
MIRGLLLPLVLLLDEKQLRDGSMIKGGMLRFSLRAVWMLIRGD